MDNVNNADSANKLYDIMKMSFYHSLIKRTLAFTLAETLIVIGVIGIVSALTLPNLNNSTGEKEKVAKVKKIYQNLNDAFGRAEAVYGPYDEWFINDSQPSDKSKRAGERITEFIKISKNCGMLANQGCAPSTKLKNIRGAQTSSLVDASTDHYKVITADGTTLVFLQNTEIYVDIDGPNKGPNTKGMDVFSFQVLNESGISTIEPYGSTLNFETLLVNLYTNGASSTTWIIKYDNADYLQFTDRNGTCKNGNVVTETNPTCK